VVVCPGGRVVDVATRIDVPSQLSVAVFVPVGTTERGREKEVVAAAELSPDVAAAVEVGKVALVET